MKRFLTATVLSVALQTPSAWADQGPAWAADAVRAAVSAGVMQDEGDRPVTRYEAAQIFNRVLQLDEQAHEDFATRDEASALRGETAPIQEDLSDMTHRVDNLETNVDRLRQRVKRVRPF